MRRFARFFVAVSMATAGVVGMGTGTASAHFHDLTNALYACWEGGRPFGSYPNSMMHAHPLEMGPGWVRYRCENHAFDDDHCVRWEVVLLADRSIWGPLDGSVVYREC